ncbi:MAG: hypothetical protein ACOCWZ_11625 [Spirochaetota bacterium]
MHSSIHKTIQRLFGSDYIFSLYYGDSSPTSAIIVLSEAGVARYSEVMRDFYELFPDLSREYFFYGRSYRQFVLQVQYGDPEILAIVNNLDVENVYGDKSAFHDALETRPANGYDGQLLLDNIEGRVRESTHAMYNILDRLLQVWYQNVTSSVQHSIIRSWLSNTDDAHQRIKVKDLAVLGMHVENNQAVMNYLQTHQDNNIEQRWNLSGILYKELQQAVVEREEYEKLLINIINAATNVLLGEG